MKIITQKELAAIEADKKNLFDKCQGLETELENIKNMSKDMTEKQAELNNVIAAMKDQYNKSFDEQKAAYEKQATEAKAISDKVKAESDKQLADMKAATEKQLADMKANYETQISDYKAKVELAEASSEAKAIKALANIGVPADELPRVTTTDKTQVLEEAKKLQGRALSDYFEQNKKAIFEALKEANKKDK